MEHAQCSTYDTMPPRTAHTYLVLYPLHSTPPSCMYNYLPVGGTNCRCFRVMSHPVYGTCGYSIPR